MKIKFFGFMTLLFIFASLSSSASEVRQADLNLQLIKFDDQYISVFSGRIDIKKHISTNVQLDSTGYLSLGMGYNDIYQNIFWEAYVNYGKVENLDIYTSGIFAIKELNQLLSIYVDSAYEWRKTTGFPITGIDWFDQTEWRTTLGGQYNITKTLAVGYGLNHDRLLSGSSVITEVSNKNVNSHNLSLTYSYKVISPYVRFTHGEYRVRPGEPITKDNSWEFGVNWIF